MSSSRLRPTNHSYHPRIINISTSPTTAPPSPETLILEVGSLNLNLTHPSQALPPPRIPPRGPTQPRIFTRRTNRSASPSSKSWKNPRQLPPTPLSLSQYHTIVLYPGRWKYKKLVLKACLFHVCLSCEEGFSCTKIWYTFHREQNSGQVAWVLLMHSSNRKTCLLAPRQGKTSLMVCCRVLRAGAKEFES